MPHPRVGLVICTILNRHNVDRLISTYIENFNAKLVEADRKPPFHGPTRVFITPNLPAGSLNPDGLHPNNQGTRVLEQAFLDQLA